MVTFLGERGRQRFARQLTLGSVLILRCRLTFRRTTMGTIEGHKIVHPNPVINNDAYYLPMYFTRHDGKRTGLPNL